MHCFNLARIAMTTTALLVLSMPVNAWWMKRCRRLGAIVRIRTPDNVKPTAEQIHALIRSISREKRNKAVANFNIDELQMGYEMDHENQKVEFWELPATLYRAERDSFDFEEMQKANEGQLATKWFCRTSKGECVDNILMKIRHAWTQEDVVCRYT